MSSIKEQRTRLFQEKLQELGDIGTKERSEDAAPFYDKPTTMEQAVRKTEKEENFKEEASSPLQFTDYEACYLCPQSSKGGKIGLHHPYRSLAYSASRAERFTCRNHAFELYRAHSSCTSPSVSGTPQ